MQTPISHAAVTSLLQQKHEIIIEDAVTALSRSHLSGYERDGLDVAKARLEKLFELTVHSIEERQLDDLTKHMQSTAEARYSAGYEISELQTAINVLEESIWKNILPGIKPAELAEALGFVGTVLGAAKDLVARAYVSLAGQTHVKSLNLEALFRGTSGI